MIKYNQVSSSGCEPAFSLNVVTMTKALKLLVDEGHGIDEESLACMSPYQTEHINRFGRYTLNRNRVPERLDRLESCVCRPDQKGFQGKKIKRV
jgi:hypothetical protein